MWVIPFCFPPKTRSPHITKTVLMEGKVEELLLDMKVEKERFMRNFFFCLGFCRSLFRLSRMRRVHFLVPLEGWHRRKMETVTVRMSRGDRTTPWGFGVTEAPSRDVVIVNVVGGSLADRAGLRNGDILDELEGLRNLDINATDRLLVTSRDKIELVVHRESRKGEMVAKVVAMVERRKERRGNEGNQAEISSSPTQPLLSSSSSSSSHSSSPIEHDEKLRRDIYEVYNQLCMVQITASPKPWNGSGGGASRVWRPEITQNTEMHKFQDSTHQMPYKVSLEHNNSSIPPKGFNNAAMPFNTDPRVKHLQYNSPMNLYSNTAAAEQYAQQTQGIVQNDSSLGRARSDQPSYMRSETLKVLKEHEQNGHSSHPNPQGLPVCYVCTKPILGLMAQAAGHQLHGDCLACATCGTSLKNIGHHYIDGKFYCDIHQRLKRATSTGPADPNLMARIPPTAAQPTRPSEPPRGAYQPDGINRRPLSVSPNPGQWSSTQQSLNVSVSNPRTQGVISPANRGVPSSQMYGNDLNRGGSRAPQDYRPSPTLAPPSGAPPPPPSSQPPIDPSMIHDVHLRVPSSLRAAVSPRRRARLPREWPPSKGQVKTTPFWNTELHQPACIQVPSKPHTVSLHDAVFEMDTDPEERKESPRRMTILERSPSGTTFKSSPKIINRPSSVQFEPISSQPELLKAVQVQVKEVAKLDVPPLSTSTPRIEPEPAKAMIKTDAITSDQVEQISESSDQSSISETQNQNQSSDSNQLNTSQCTQTTQTSPGLVEDGVKENKMENKAKKLQKKPGRKDPRRLTAIYTPNLEETPIEIEVNDEEKVVMRPEKTQTVTVELDARRASTVHVPEISNLPPIQDTISRFGSIPKITSPRPFVPLKESVYSPVKKLAESPVEPIRKVSESPILDQYNKPSSSNPSPIKIGPLLKSLPRDQLPEGIIGINVISKPFKAPDMIEFPSHRKRYSYNVAEEQKVNRPAELASLPPLMKGKQVVTPQGSPFSTLTRQKDPRSIEERNQQLLQRTPSPKGTLTRRTPSPVLNISIQPLPTRNEEDHSLKSVSTLRKAYEQQPTQIRQSPVMGIQSLGKRTPSPGLKKVIEKKNFIREDSRTSQNEFEGNQWAKVSEVVDESDIMTDTSRRSDESTNAAASELSDVAEAVKYQPLNQYDVDESELVKIRKSQKSNQEDTDVTDIDSDEEKERWMREELELARKEELVNQMIHWEKPIVYRRESPIAIRGEQNLNLTPNQRQTFALKTRLVESIDENANWDDPSERDTLSMVSESDEWRKKAMELLDDETQFDRDMQLVAKLHQQLEECRGMDEGDRQKAIYCMKRHKKTLASDQRLEKLLDSAIHFVAHLEEPQRLQWTKDMAGVENYEEPIKREQRMSRQGSREKSGPGSTPYPPERKNFGQVQVHPMNPVILQEEKEILDELGRFDVRNRENEGQESIVKSESLKRGPIIPEIDYPMDSPIFARKNYETLPIRTEQLSNVLEELNNIMKPRSSDFISRKLKSVQQKETQEKVNSYASNRQNQQQQQQTTRTTDSHTLLNQPAQGGKVPFCEACKQQIRGAFVLAQGLSWCPEHFICANASCGRRLLECGFVEENGQKFCENCFENNIAPRCAKCARPIVSDCLNALQKKWHPQCFTCAHCSKPFGNSAFYLEQGLPYCENDWNRLFTTKCYQCTYPIEAGDRWVEALGHAYHSNCFNCTRCNVNLEGESFYAKNGEPFCKLHA
ncbi:unnamed protein product, partial [Mesorhabditis belari]|uniref:Uncharacterized protein n=1 Tax=Mesorhabditis belari TaxID=2138241 RepID=A0AAF3EB28_9BILA